MPVSVWCLKVVIGFGVVSVVQALPFHDSASACSASWTPPDPAVVYSPTARQFAGPEHEIPLKALADEPAGSAGALAHRDAPEGGRAGHPIELGRTRTGQNRQLTPGTAVPHVAELPFQKGQRP